MRKKQLILSKLVLTILLIIFTLGVCTIKTDAASTSLTASSTSVTVGTKVTVTAKGTAAAWDLEISGDGISSTKIVGYTDDAENGSFSKSVSFTPTSAGTYTIKLTGNVTDEANTEATSVSKSISINVKAKNTSSGGNSSSGATDNSNDNIPNMSFSSVNETVYATASVNVRANHSTNSSIIGSLSEGDSVTRTGIGDGWSRIKYGGQTAYVSSSYLTTTKPASIKEDDKKEDTTDDEKDKSNTKELSSLIVDKYKLEPDFSPDITEYNLTVGKDVEDLEIEAIASDENAEVEITGNKGLLLGENTINIKVTAEDGTVKTYKINVTKVEETGIKLSELSIDGYALTPEFSSDVYEYTLNIGDTSITNLNINAKSDLENVLIEIAGNNDLKPGKNIITILVSSDNDDITTVYQIVVNIDEEYNTQVIGGIDNKDLYMYIGIGVAAIVLLIIIIVVIVRKRRKEDGDFAPLNTYDLDFSLNKKDDLNESSIEDTKDEENVEKKNRKSRKQDRVNDENDYSSLTSGTQEIDEIPRRRGKHF